MTTAKPFWMISGTGCGAPTFRHPSYEAAEAEAKRLARAHPGTEFVILKSVASAIKQDVEVKPIEDRWRIGIDFSESRDFQLAEIADVFGLARGGFTGPTKGRAKL